MSMSELHDWECAIERLGGENAGELLKIAQDIYNTAFVHGRNEGMAIRALKNEQTDGDLISRQSVLKCFNVRELKFKNKEDAELMKHYLELSFNNLAKLPSYNSIKTELNGDLISRQSVIGIVEFECGEWKGLSKTIVKAIEQLPSAEKTAESEDKE